ncbi:outer membrane adhesin like protein [Monoraphidium neglectum]|uniref:Outer membrane adhesin like protein n=1 Tax=Monoraphidium neglectum TaxID=145388 RepID=A0A0D2JB99_9CHLO|nr:outer membrane adhesin like proteiin [Monoraphidium neglectum]KIY97037.1 outer membrane adhesin like protein [Monoraphidium neglectum]|eukprot:XP_013896057.1 outer membrane adhesin like proteiin [Monoraphidium neglectum]
MPFHHNDWSGTAAAGAVGAASNGTVIDADPRLRSITLPWPAGQQGPVTFWVPQASSPVVDVGDNPGNDLADIRGLARVVGAAADIGAAENQAPVAASNLSATLNEDTAFDAPAPGVLSGAIDADQDVMTVSVVLGPTNGTLALAANGSYKYVPNPNFFGVDGFVFQASDGARASAAQRVTLIILPVEDPPIAGNVTYSVNQDFTLSIPAPGVLSRSVDYDPSDTLTAVLQRGNGPNNGVLTLAADGSFNYTPNTGFAGVDGFNFTMKDSGGGADAQAYAAIIIVPNEPPSATDLTFVAKESTVLTIGAAAGVLAAATDPDGDLPLTAVVLTRNGPQHGAVNLGLDGSFVYEPVAGYNGADAFNFTVRDKRNGTVTRQAFINISE